MQGSGRLRVPLAVQASAGNKHGSGKEADPVGLGQRQEGAGGEQGRAGQAEGGHQEEGGGQEEEAGGDDQREAEQIFGSRR